jgi:glycosyltransferase involved in cell wall biosynthesis
MSNTVSIILPTYNRAGLLGRAVESVLNQTFQDFELIIVDDGSTDNTEKLVASFSTDKIRYVRHSNNKGVSAARNTGLRLAGGDYITFQDSDDEWMPDKLEKQIAIFKIAPPSVGIVYCGSVLVMHGRTRYIRCFEYRVKNHNIFSNIAERFFVTTPTLMLRRQCFEAAGGFDESLPVQEDWELFLRMSKLYSYIGIDEFLMTRYLQPDSLTGNNCYFVKAFGLLVEKYFDDIKQDAKLLSKCYFKLGHCLIVQGDIRQGRCYLLKGAKANPLNLKNPIVFLLSLPGKTVYKTLTQIYRRIRLAITGYQF